MEKFVEYKGHSCYYSTMRIFLKWVKENWIVLSVLTILIIIAYTNSLNNVFVSEDRALAALKQNLKALKIVPDNPQLYVNMEVIYLKMKDKKAAEQFFLKALSIDPNNQQAKLGLLEVNK